MERKTCIFTTVLLMSMLLFPLCAAADIICNCGMRSCICFVQIGDEGIAVSAVIDLLAEQGYLQSDKGSTFDHRVYDAVCEFQKDHAIMQSGIMDDDTLTMLIWGKQLPEQEVSEVWVPTDGGKKRHSKSTCSNMEDPRKMSSINAQKLGIEACKRCNPQ